MTASDRVPTFEDFVVVEMPRLLGLATALTGNRHDAWDLTQEALARVGIRWSKVDIADPGAYARTTLVRLNVDRLRRLKRERPTLSLPDAVAHEAPTYAAAPWLVEALRSLTPRQRTAIALRFVVDLDMNEIAREMNCSVGTVKCHLSRGLDRVRSHASSRSLDETAVQEG